MKKTNIIFLVIIMFLTFIIYFQESELTKAEEYNEMLNSELYEIENDLIEVNSKLEDKEEEFDALKIHYKMEHETRNLIDAKVRAICDAIGTKNIEYLKSVVSSNVQTQNDRLIFANGYAFILSERNNDFVLKQRDYTLYKNNLQFYTDYELISDGDEYLHIYNFEFINEDGKWKLNKLIEK